MAKVYWQAGDIRNAPVGAALTDMSATALLRWRTDTGRAARIGQMVIGIALGGCVDAVGTERRGAFRRKAHAHIAGEHRGWICVLSADPRRLLTPAGKPTRLLWHEWAHIYVHAGHTQRFRALLKAVGQPGAIR